MNPIRIASIRDNGPFLRAPSTNASETIEQEQQRALYHVLDGPLTGQQDTHESLRQRYQGPIIIIDRTNYAVDPQGKPMQRIGWTWQHIPAEKLPKIRMSDEDVTE